MQAMGVASRVPMTLALCSTESGPNCWRMKSVCMALTLRSMTQEQTKTSRPAMRPSRLLMFVIARDDQLHDEEDAHLR